MRRSRRNFLSWLAVLVLLVAVLGGVAATGHLPPLNRWIERRLLAELRAAGVGTETTRLRELSWRSAVAGPVSFDLPGLHVQLDEARAELGWRVLTGRLAPRVVLRGLSAELDLARWAELARALPTSDGGLPAGEIDIEAARLMVRNGAARVEVPFAGSLSADVAELRVRLAAEGPAFSGRVTLRRSVGSGDMEFAVQDGSFEAERWRTVLVGLVGAPLPAAQAEPAGRIRISGTARFASGRWTAVRGDAELPALIWREGARTIDCGAAKVQGSFENETAWQLDVTPERVGWSENGWRAELLAPEITVRPEAMRVVFQDGTLKGAGVALDLGGEATVRDAFAPTGPATAEAVLRVARGEWRDWRLSAPAELRARWNGAELGLSLESLELDGPYRLQAAAWEATLGGWREGHPRIVARGQGALELGRLLGAPGAEWRCEPAMVAAKIDLSGVLDAGAEAVRLELALPAMRRTFAFSGGRFEAVLGGDAVVNLDRSHVSGRASLAAHEVLARQGGWSVLAPEASFNLRWPRVWLAGVERWTREPVARLWRELLWAGDYDLQANDTILRRGEGEWCATGMALQMRTRGAELHESGGATISATAAELTDGTGRRATSVSADAAFGLEGGTLRLAGTLPEFALNAETEQVVRWADGIEAEGTFGFDPVTLSGKEPLARWWPALRGFEITGGLGLSGRNRFANGEWSFGGDVLLKDLGVRWTAREAAVEGLRGRLAWSGPQWRTEPEQTLTYAWASFDGMELVNGSATFGLDAAGRLAVSRFATGGLGGQIECTPFAFELRRPELETRLNLNGVRLEQLLELTENVPAEAEGAMDGSIPLHWSDGRLGVGTGYLRLTPGEMGRMHFTRDLRLLTSGRKPGGMEYKALRQVEESMMDLIFDRLQIDTYPKDESGRSARIRVIGVPSGGEQRMPVSLDVNVNAPLAHFLKWGRMLSISGWNSAR
ncbi:MAG TPA: YdbH domain-containing protein [Opitutaceae bacterium]|nr:YdbH domain-containing protein [Opitutaceae bacterium]